MNGAAGATAALCALLVALPARASERPQRTWATPTWAGYLTRASTGSFSSVRGTWTQPRVVCDRPGSAVSFWVGLGGARRDSRSLEQIGTSADCDGTDVLSTSAWYELFPAPPVDIPVAIRAGDTVSASVTVDATDVLVTLDDVTTGASYTQRRAMVNPAPEADSAEWIAEAPSSCFRTCDALPIAHFARVRFCNAEVEGIGREGERFRVTMPFASPTALSTSGSAFAVIQRRTG